MPERHSIPAQAVGRPRGATSVVPRPRRRRRAASSPSRSMPRVRDLARRSRRSRRRRSTRFDPPAEHAARPVARARAAISASSVVASTKRAAGPPRRKVVWSDSDKTPGSLSSGPIPSKVVPQVLDIEQALLLLELEPPFEKRDVQLARRRQAKIWHPDLAPPGKQIEHERHLKAINEAADQLENAGRGLARRARLAQRRQGQRRRRARRPRRGRPPRLRGGAGAPRPRGRRAPERPVRRARPRPLGRPPLRALPVLSGVGRRRGRGHLLHRRRGRHPAVGARALPAGRPDGARGLAAVRRLLQARPRPRARAALHDRRAARDGRGRLQARGAAADLRARRRADQHRGAAAADAGLLAGGVAERRGPRGPRLDPRRPDAARRAALRGADLRGHARVSTSPREAALRAAELGPDDASSWERVGRLRLRADGPRRRARGAGARAPRSARPSRACSTSRWPTTSAATSAARSPRPSRRRCSTASAPTPGRATPTRSPAPTASATRSPPPSARSTSPPTTRRSPTCSTASAPPSRACCPPPDPPSPVTRHRTPRHCRPPCPRPHPRCSRRSVYRRAVRSARLAFGVLRRRRFTRCRGVAVVSPVVSAAAVSAMRALGVPARCPVSTSGVRRSPRSSDHATSRRHGGIGRRVRGCSLGAAGVGCIGAPSGRQVRCSAYSTIVGSRDIAA